MTDLISTETGEKGARVVTGIFGRHSFPMHSHTDFALCVVENGLQGFTSRTSKAVLHKGCFASVNPGDLHNGYNAGTDGWRQHVLFFTNENTAKFISENNIKKYDFAFSRNTSDNTVIAEIITEKISSVSSSENLLKKQCLFEEIMALLHYREKIFSPSKAVKTGSVRRSVEKMSDAPEERHSLDDLAKLSGMSRFHFLRSFRQSTGLTPHAYLTQLRLDKAFRLLISTDMPLSRIAAECGYCDQPHFVRSFKKLWGTTPGSIKRK
ncbi:MAG: helix-turn-helix domain-containing protein [Deferribacterales bacterium]